MLAWIVYRDGDRIAAWYCIGQDAWDLVERRELAADELDALLSFDPGMSGALDTRLVERAYRRRMRAKKRRAAKSAQVSGGLPCAPYAVGWLEGLYALPDSRS